MNFLPLTMRTNLVFALVLVAFPIAIFCTGPAATEVRVKDDFVAPKSSIVTLINELHASAPLDYFANLSTKVSSLTSADFVPTASASEFSFYLKDTTETAETYITNIVSNAATDDAAIAELVKFEDLSTEVTNSIPPTVPISLKAFSDFIVMFDFTDGKFAKSNAATKAWNFTLDEFMDYFKFYVSAQGDKDNLVKNIVEEVNKKNCKSNDEVKTELCSFLSGKFQDKSTGNIEITFTELKTALLTIVIDDSFQLSQGTPAGTTKSLFLDGDTAAFKKLLESDQTKTFVTFIDTATTEVETIFSSIALSTNGDNGNAQLKSTFDNLATLLNNYAKNLFKKTIAKDELNKIFTAKFSAPLPAITDTDISDDDCKIGSLPYLIPDPADTKACFNEYVLFLKDKNKFTNPRQLSIAQIMTILKSNLTEFKTALEDKKRADDAQMAADKEQQEKDDGGKTKEAGEKKKEEGEKQTTSSNSPADGKKKDAPLKSTTSQPKKGMPSYIIALIWAGGITAGIGVIGGIWYFFNKQGSKV